MTLSSRRWIFVFHRAASTSTPPVALAARVGQEATAEGAVKLVGTTDAVGAMADKVEQAAMLVLVETGETSASSIWKLQ